MTPSLPTGTLTFLFTDIEGSTARWEHQRDAMAAALVRHDELVRGAIASAATAVGRAHISIRSTAWPS